MVCSNTPRTIFFIKSVCIQKVPNAAARVICFIPKYDQITLSLIKLHWFPVKQGIEFKIALLVFKAVNGMSPVYLSNLPQIQPTRRYSINLDLIIKDYTDHTKI